MHGTNLDVEFEEIVEIIGLAELLKRWDVADDEYNFAEVASINAIRQREGILRKYLPAGLVRRLDTGLARSATIHPDTGKALYLICRALQPQCVFETGTYWGYATSYLAAAVKDNEMGQVHTFDLYEHAGKYVPQNLRKYIEFHCGQPSIQTMPVVLRHAPPQLFFQDSLHDYAGVCEELKVVRPFLAPDAVILFHDFIAPEVRRAAVDMLPDYTIRLLQSEDPQQMGVAFRKTTIV